MLYTEVAKDIMNRNVKRFKKKFKSNELCHVPKAITEIEGKM